MKIKWLGQACFSIEADSKSAPGRRVSIVTDPYSPDIGYRLPADLVADIVTVSHQHGDHNYTAGVGGSPQIVAAAGATTPAQIAKDVEFVGIPSFHDDEQGAKRGPNTIFAIDVEGLRLVHLGDLGHLLTEAQIKAVGDVDILFIPVGGIYTIDADAAAKVVAQTKPKIVIPMHYKTGALVFPLAGVEPFIEKLGLSARRTATLEIRKETLPKEMEAAVLVC